VAMIAAVDHLVSIAAGRPPVAILGDMYELGPGADAFHRAVGEHCAAAGVRVVAVGDLGRGYLTGAAGERWFPDVEECIAALPGVAPAGSAVLVKASRLLRLERVAEALTAAGPASADDVSAASASAAPEGGDDA
jgi:UDP-N-acetylmuramoyl-tripeptide--D-alanyl-D-alanine ligase